MITILVKKKSISLKNNVMMEVYLTCVSNYYQIFYNLEELISFLKKTALKKKINSIDCYFNNLTLEGGAILKYAFFKKKKKILISNSELLLISFEEEGIGLKFFCIDKLCLDNLENNISWHKKIVGDASRTEFINVLEDFFKKIEYLDKNKCQIESWMCELNQLKNKTQNMFALYKMFKISQKHEEILSISGFVIKCFYKNFNFFSIDAGIKENLDTYVRPHYYGGRCEVFNNPILNEGIYFWDFNNMYPNIMLDDFPYGTGRFEPSVVDFDKRGFYDISFTSNDMDLPILPHKNRYTSKLMFTNGEGRGVYWCEEIELFLKNSGKINKIHGAYIYDAQGPVFSSFVEVFSKKRDEGLISKNNFKTLLNTFYGRMALKQSSHDYLILSSFEELKPFLNQIGVESFFTINDMWVLEYNPALNSSFSSNNKIKKNKFSNVIYPTIIAAKGRIKLYKTFQKIINGGGTLLYCDTDSIFASFKSAPNIEIENSKSLEKKIKNAVFISSKCYALKFDDGTEEKTLPLGNYTFDQIESSFFKKNGLKINFPFYTKRKFSKDKIATSPYLFYKDEYI